MGARKIRIVQRQGTRLLWLVVLAGCSGTSELAELPPDTGTQATETDTASGWFPLDTGLTDTESNEEPEHTLELSQLGDWSLSPVGDGPYTALTGTLLVTELLDGDLDTPWCRLEFALTGDPADTVCEGCEFAMEVSFYLVSEGAVDDLGEPILDEDGMLVGGVDSCQTPDLPSDGDTWRFGLYDEQDMLYLDYQGSGVWLPWYAVARLRSNLDFSWSATVGYRPDEDD